MSTQADRDLEWRSRRAEADIQRAMHGSKVEEKQDEVALQSYVQDKLAPFDDYQFGDLDESAVRVYILRKLQQ